MKTTTLVIFFGLFISISNGQNKKTDNYFPLFESASTAKYFKMGNSSYLDYFLDKKIQFGENEYNVRIRKYSWGVIDTAYFREDDKYYYHYYPKVNKESIFLPKIVSIGQKWLEEDKSWSYEIIGIDEKLETPKEKYKDLVVVECYQITDRDKDKSKVYHMYYARDIGMVGSVNNGKLTSYLSEIKKNSKKGETIGN